MKIIQLQAENFKRLKAVSIKPNGDMVQISGKNGQGKSSIVDAIWAALGGVENMPSEPVRLGTTNAVIRLDLGEYIVTRKIKAKEDGNYTTSLVVETPDGMKAKSPQTLLNDLVGRFSLDPMAFVRMSAKEQFDSMKFLVPGLDLDQIKENDARDRELRTVENRKAKEMRAAAAAIATKLEKAERVDTASITADISRATDHNKSIAERQARRDEAKAKADSLEAHAQKCKEDIGALQKQIEALKEVHTVSLNECAILRDKLAKAVPLEAPLDTAALAKLLVGAQEANGEADKQERRDELLRQAQNHEKSAQALTEAMEAREEHKRAAIASAKFPVEGLSLGDETVLIDGVPFAQAATSQKIEASVSLAMAMNPTIRVIRITDGSLLDSDALKIVASMAKASDFQVWIETVSDGTGSGIIIEDGQVKGE